MGEVEYNPTTLRKALGSARVEEDDFVINDIPLKIPPTQIHIEKQSMNYEWQTLRTRSPISVKSGHGSIYVALDIIFKSEDFVALIKLVAGLKSTPFCSVYNHFLEDQLRSVLSDSVEPAYKTFQPVVLALTGMTFGTMGHEGYADCINGHLEFMFFNYTPYTPIFAYKSGPLDDKPGMPWSSEIWRKFYEPFVLEASLPREWPHISMEKAPTVFRFREFQYIPAQKGIVNKSTDQLVEDMERKNKQSSSNFPFMKDPAEVAAAEYLARTKRQTDVSSDLEGWQHLKENDLDIKFSRDFKVAEISKQQLFCRNRSITLAPSTDAIIEQIVVSFRNTFAIIPMAGHSYPTCQFLGNSDPVVLFTINTSNAAAGKLQRAYDLVESTNLSFKQIPQGFRNIEITNDFLGLFGIKEVMQKGISVDTILGKPGRSKVVLELHRTELTTKTTFDNPEEIKQEYVISDDSTRRKVFEVLSKYLREEGSKSKEFDTYKLEYYGIVFDTNNSAFVTLLEKARDLYNDFHKKTTAQVFRGSYWGHNLNPYNGAANFVAIQNVSEQKYVFVPLLDKFKQNLQSLLKNSWDCSKDLHQAMGDNLNKLGTGGSPNKKPVDYQKQITEVNLTEKEQEDLLRKLGFFDYVNKMQSLLDNIITGYLDLPQLVHLKPNKQKLGLGMGKCAYPDFIPQISSVASYSMGSSATDEQLIFYEPDAYLWYPIYAGSTGTLSDILDSRLMNVAKDQSLKVFQNAQGKVSQYFKEEYLSRLARNLTKEVARGKFNPYDVLIKNLDEDKHPGELAPNLYPEQEITNATRGENITHTVVPDPGKTQTNWYKEYASPIKSGNILTHTTSFNKMWEGVDSANNQPLQQSSPKADYFPNDHGNPKSSSVVPGSTGTGVGVVPGLSFTWKRNPSKQANELGCISPVKTSSSVGRPLEVRKLSFGGKDWWKTNKRGVIKHWNNLSLRMLLKQQGYTTSPDDAAIQLSKETGVYKTFRQWTLDDYTKWKNNGDRKLGRVHCGVDVWCAVGTDVYAIYNGVVKFIQRSAPEGEGLWVHLIHPEHPHIKSSVYMHLQAIDPSLREGQKVEKGQCFAVSGKSGSTKMGAHLHFELWGDNQRSKLLNPKDYISKWKTNDPAKRYVPPAGSPQADKARDLSTRSVPKDITSTSSAPLVEAINEFKYDLLTGQAQTLRRAYPTFKLYFIEDDSGERKRLAFDDFFSYNAVKSIRVIQSREIPADLCMLELTNVSGLLSNRKFKQDEYVPGSGRGKEAVESIQGRARTNQGEISKETHTAMNTNTTKENPIASLLLQEGIQISLKLGYSSNPEDLELVFTGHITNIEFTESDDLVQIIAQSYATELTQDIKGFEEPIKKVTAWWPCLGFQDNASTGRILEEMLAQPEVLHFGRWQPVTGGTPLRELLTDKFQFSPAPADDNIFAPNRETEATAVANGLIFKDLKYVISKTTIWDIFKEMELRHPNFISSPVPYKGRFGDRMTMFYGMPNQLYFCRDATPDEEKAQEKLKNLLSFAELEIASLANNYRSLRPDDFNPATNMRIGMGTVPPAYVNKMAYEAMMHVAPDGTTNYLKKFEKAYLGPVKEKMMQIARMQGYIRPFRRYHLVTSKHHIISNNIQTNSADVANTIIISYPKKAELKNGEATITERGTFILKLDNAIPAEDIKVQYGQFINASNEMLAKRYALGLLTRNLKRAYKGDLLLIGNPRIKPYDVVFLHDEQAEMAGPIEVRQITQTFTQETGFVTEIVPDMMVSASDWSLLSTNEAMGIISAGVAREVFGLGEIEFEDSPVLNKTKGFIASTLLGNDCTNLALYFTQLGQPMIINPLTHHGRPFAGGIPIRKIPTSFWKTAFGEWYAPDAAETNDWLEGQKEGFLNWLKKSTGNYSSGNLLRGWSGRSFEVE